MSLPEILLVTDWDGKTLILDHRVREMLYCKARVNAVAVNQARGGSDLDKYGSREEERSGLFQDVL